MCRPNPIYCETRPLFYERYYRTITFELPSPATSYYTTNYLCRRCGTNKSRCDNGSCGDSQAEEQPSLSCQPGTHHKVYSTSYCTNLIMFKGEPKRPLYLGRPAQRPKYTKKRQLAEKTWPPWEGETPDFLSQSTVVSNILSFLTVDD